MHALFGGVSNCFEGNCLVIIIWFVISLRTYVHSSMRSTTISMSDVDLEDSFLWQNLKAQSSTSTIGSVTSATQKPSKKEKLAAKKRSVKERRKEKEKQKKLETNKISKEDFYQKHTEFRTWLFEEKKLKFEDLSLSKAKEYFKKFVKKWNQHKLPKHYYRGIDVCWLDGSPATQCKWAEPKNVMATPGSIREETLDAKYGRKSSFGTFGKKTGKRALKQLQMTDSDFLSSPELSKNVSSSSISSKTATIKRRGKGSRLRPVSMLTAPPPPLRMDSQLSTSQPSFSTIFGTSPNMKLHELNIDDKQQSSEPMPPEGATVADGRCIEDSPRLLNDRKRPSAGSLEENDHKMVKKDSYTEKIMSASQALFPKSGHVISQDAADQISSAKSAAILPLNSRSNEFIKRQTFHGKTTAI